jgi:hypothetical protein
MSTRLMRECRQQRGNRTGMATRNFKGRQIWEWTFPGLQAPVGCRKAIPPTSIYLKIVGLRLLLLACFTKKFSDPMNNL